MSKLSDKIPKCNVEGVNKSIEDLYEELALLRLILKAIDNGYYSYEDEVMQIINVRNNELTSDLEERPHFDEELKRATENVINQGRLLAEFIYIEEIKKKLENDKTNVNQK